MMEMKRFITIPGRICFPVLVDGQMIYSPISPTNGDGIMFGIMRY